MNRYRIFTIIIMVCALLFSGCGVSGSRRVLEDLRLVRTLGYDRAGRGVALSAAAEQPGEAEPLLLRRKAGTVREAIDALETAAGDGEPYFAHVESVVIGREAAEAGLAPLFDYMERDESLRLGTRLYLLAEGEAGSLFDSRAEEPMPVSDALATALRDFEQGGGAVPDLRETALSLSEYGAAAVCLLRTEGDPSGRRSLRPTGYGLLRDGKLTALLEGGLGDALGLLRSVPGTHTRAVEGVAFRWSGETAYYPSWNRDGSPGPLEISVRVRAGATELTEGAAAPETAAKDLEEALREDAEELLNLCRGLDADPLGLGGVLRRSGGASFEALDGGWLKDLEYRLDLRVELDQSFDLEEGA